MTNAFIIYILGQYIQMQLQAKVNILHNSFENSIEPKVMDALLKSILQSARTAAPDEVSFVAYINNLIEINIG